MRIFTFVRCFALSLSLLCLLFSGRVTGQIRYDITWPADGAVYQQNSVGKGIISVRGVFNSRSFINGFYRIRLSLQPLDVKTGVPVPGGTIIYTDVPRNTNAFASLFGTQITSVSGGWYSLKAECIPLLWFLPRFVSKPVKVGVGEVFLIAGQSNAQGLPNKPNSYKVAQPFGAAEAYDGVRVDKNFNVSKIETAAGNIQNVTFFNWLFNFGPIVPSTGVNNLVNVQDAGIGPTGGSLWYWAKLGEKIVNEKNVPIAFFNAAWGGTTITEWERSIDPSKKVAARRLAANLPEDHDVWGDKTPNLGLPYSLLRRTLNLYTSLYGARAVLWMQGETDASTQADTTGWGPVRLDNWDQTRETYNRTVRSSTEYAQKLQRIIAESRTLFQNTSLPWVVAKASYQTSASGTNTSQLVRDGQEIVITSTPGVMRGPDMDQIFGPDKRRTLADQQVPGDGYGDEPTHFKGSGLTDAATAWFDALVGPGKLLNSTLPPITVTDLGTGAQSVGLADNEQTLVAPAGTTYRWLDEAAAGFIDPNQPISTQQYISATGACNNCAGAALASSAGNNLRRALVQNANGNFIITQAVPYPYVIVDDTQPPATFTTNACYNIKVEKTGKRLQAMGDNSIQQSNSNGANDQIWKVDDRGNGRVSFTVQDGTSRAIQTTSGANQGVGLVLSGYAANRQYDWGVQASPSDANLWRVFYPANNNTWDLEGYASGPRLQIYGNTAESFYDYRAFRFEAATCPTGGASCNFAPATITANVSNPTCGQAVTLQGGCNGADCGGVSYAWSGNGISGSGSSVAINLPTANGSYAYTLTLSKPGCANQTATITLTVTGCTTTTTFASCIEAESGTGNRNPQSDANASGGQHVGGFGNSGEFMSYAFNLPTPGSYQLNLRYATAITTAVDVLVNGGGTQRFALPTTGGWVVWADSPTLTLSLGAGSNTLRIQGAVGNLSLDKVCLSTSGGGRLAAASVRQADGPLVTVSPNPTNDEVRVRFWARAGERVTLGLHTLGGRTLHSEIITAREGQNEAVLRLGGLAAGVYLVETRLGGQRVTNKVLKE